MKIERHEQSPHTIANRLARENQALRRHLRQVLGAIDTSRGWAKALQDLRADLRVKDAREYMNGAAGMKPEVQS